MKKLTPQATKNAIIAIRTTSATKAVADKAAKVDNRSLSQWVEVLILKAVEDKKNVG